jgi:hypothetical protein
MLQSPLRPCAEFCVEVKEPQAIINTANRVISEKPTNFRAPVVVGLACFLLVHWIDWILELMLSEIFIAFLRFGSIAGLPAPATLFSAPMEQNKSIIFFVFFITASCFFALMARFLGESGVVS